MIKEALKTNTAVYVYMAVYELACFHSHIVELCVCVFVSL